MKAMVLEEVNTPLVYREIPDPVIEEPDDVIIKVHCLWFVYDMI